MAMPKKKDALGVVPARVTANADFVVTFTYTHTPRKYTLNILKGGPTGTQTFDGWDETIGELDDFLNDVDMAIERENEDA